MTRTEWIKGSATFLLVIVAGYFSTAYLDRHFAVAEVNENAEPTTPSTACVGEDGSWKNWQYPNVPMLSPKC